MVWHPGPAHILEPVVGIAIQQTGSSVAAHELAWLDALCVAGGEAVFAVASPQAEKS